jgi:hypothetical protein
MIASQTSTFKILEDLISLVFIVTFLLEILKTD